MIQCKTLPTIILTSSIQNIQPAQIDFKSVIFQKNNELLQQKRQEHKEEILRVIKILEADDLNLPVIKILKCIENNEDQPNVKEILKEDASKRIIEIVRQALEEARQEINQQHRQYYENIVKDNLNLIHICTSKEKKKWFKLFQSFQSAVNIDLLTYFFDCNNQYSQKCYLEMAIWTFVQLSQLFNISPEELSCLKRYYNRYQNHFSINKQPKLRMLITVLTLARYNIKTIYMNCRCIQEISNIYSYKTKRINKSNVKDGQITDFLPIERFSFSEIAIFAKEKFLVQYPRLQKTAILNWIRDIHNNVEEKVRKILIKFGMMQFHMPIAVIEQFLRNLERNKEFKNNTFFEEDLQKDMSYLEIRIKHMFASNLLQNKAIQKLKLQQQYNTKLDANFTLSQCRTDVLACFARAAIAIVKQYFFCTALQLQAESKHQPFLAITKFYFSYQSIKKSKNSPKKSDTIMTLVLGTQGKNVVFYRLYRQKLADKRYLMQLMAILKQLKLRLPASIVLFESQLYDHLRWHHFKYLVKFIARLSRSRLYASIHPAYYQLNRYLNSCILTYIKFFAPIMNKELFYPLCEKLTEKVIILFRKSSN